MARICNVTPARAGTRNGNRHTAQRWARFLRSLGHRVSVMVQWDGRPCELLLALHARRSHASVLAYRERFAAGPLVVTLTGTDLYKDLPSSREARQSLRLADRIIVLQEDAVRFLDPDTRKKARVVYQSADPRVRHAPPKARFRVAVIGHLREVKDPFRAIVALSHLKKNSFELELIQIGDSLSPEMKRAAEQWMIREPRYHWLGGRTHTQTLRWLAHSHLLVVSSVMEGGANVISEAARIGTPVLASRMSGNLGMLGRSYPGYFPLGDERALGRLMERASRDGKFLGRLKRALAARRGLFAPAAEKAALGRVVREALQ
jgi:putative glycosyltransferase (TIGR04348 family)